MSLAATPDTGAGRAGCPQGLLRDSWADRPCGIHQKGSSQGRLTNPACNNWNQVSGWAGSRRWAAGGPCPDPSSGLAGAPAKLPQSSQTRTGSSRLSSEGGAEKRGDRFAVPIREVVSEGPLPGRSQETGWVGNAPWLPPLSQGWGERALGLTVMGQSPSRGQGTVGTLGWTVTGRVMATLSMSG